jgi:FkbM family methyltransferase
MRKILLRLILKIKQLLEIALFYISFFCVRFLPQKTLTRIKQNLLPITILDYQKKNLLLHADCEQDWYRARACQKEPETVQWIENNIRPGDVFYDIGANVGAYSLVAAGHCLGQARIYAFEPSFSTYHQLCRNILLNHCESSVFPHMFCLTDINKQVIFNYHSIESGSALHTIGENYVDCHGQFFKPPFRQNILGFSIDYLVKFLNFEVPNHIKLDVDGTELEILRGADDVLSGDKVKSILVEVTKRNDQADLIEKFLQQKGYSLVSKTDRGDGLMFNYIFKRNIES